MFQTTWRHRSSNTDSGLIPEVHSASNDRLVASVGTTYWEEHCVECSAPQCYASCALYVARRDRKCARFVRGITPNRSFRGLFGFGADIEFRRWGKLEAILGNRIAMYPPFWVKAQSTVFDVAEGLVSRCSDAISRFSTARRLNGAFNVFRRAALKWQNAVASRFMHPPEHFYLKCYSMEDAEFNFQLEVVNPVTIFRAQIPILPGWNEHVFDANAILAGQLSSETRIRISVEGDKEVHVVFTWLDFVCLGATKAKAETHSAPAQKVKCVAWDLDNTLWNGVIGDSGADGVELNVDMVQLIHEFDRRGILQTIVSKNTYATAWSKIEALRLDQYFLYPAIHWGPKSESVQSIAKELNINPDTFAVIDDSEFERAEIRSALPQVRVFDPGVGPCLLDDPCFDVPVTAESGLRRQSYQTEAARKSIHANWRGDFDDFLRSCDLQLTIARPDEHSSQRCLELLQRSNQFNLSARKYDAEQLDSLLQCSQHLCFTLDVADRFGAYGIVGFAAIRLEAESAVLTEFVLSCRVAQKKIEEAFFLWFAGYRASVGEKELRACLRITSRNEPLRNVLSGLGFALMRETQDGQELLFRFPSPAILSSVIKTIDVTKITAGNPERERCAA
jgi:FkbH-like protein